MLTVLLCGDPHGRFENIIDVVDTYRPDVTILLGDIEAQQLLHLELASILSKTDIRWIPGNHDTDRPELYDNLWGSELADRNLHGRVVDINGWKIAGLGGVFRGKIWHAGHAPALYDTPDDYLARCGTGNRWQGGLPLKHRSSIFPCEMRDMAVQQADILVTHEAPGEHSCGNGAITELATSMNVVAAFHGHHHENRTYTDGVWHGIGMRDAALASFSIDPASTKSVLVEFKSNAQD